MNNNNNNFIINPNPKQTTNRGQVCDNEGNTWTIGRHLGTGGFGVIYTCKRKSRLKNALYKSAIKFEPKRKGCLKHEIAIYKDLNNVQDRQDFMDRKSIHTLGLLRYISDGTCQMPPLNMRHQRYANIRGLVTYDFLIIEKVNTSLSKHIKKTGSIPNRRIFKLALHISIALEMLHKKGYVHRDIKPSNILFNHLDEPMLIDYGLTVKFKYHDTYKLCRNLNTYTGTLEFASIDAHRENVTYISDYECLLYNIFHWSGAKLPWSIIDKPYYVLMCKEHHRLNNYREILSKLPWYFGIRKEKMDKLINLIKQVKFNEMPNHDEIHILFAEMIYKSDLDSYTWADSSKSPPASPLSHEHQQKIEKHHKEKKHSKAQQQPQQQQIIINTLGTVYDNHNNNNINVNTNINVNNVAKQKDKKLNIIGGIAKKCKQIITHVDGAGDSSEYEDMEIDEEVHVTNISSYSGDESSN